MEYSHGNVKPVKDFFLRTYRNTVHDGNLELVGGNIIRTPMLTDIGVAGLKRLKLNLMSGLRQLHGTEEYRIDKQAIVLGENVLVARLAVCTLKERECNTPCSCVIEIVPNMGEASIVEAQARVDRFLQAGVGRVILLVESRSTCQVYENTAVHPLSNEETWLLDRIGLVETLDPTILWAQCKVATDCAKLLQYVSRYSIRDFDEAAMLHVAIEGYSHFMELANEYENAVDIAANVPIDGTNSSLTKVYFVDSLFSTLYPKITSIVQLAGRYSISENLRNFIAQTTPWSSLTLAFYVASGIIAEQIYGNNNFTSIYFLDYMVECCNSPQIVSKQEAANFFSGVLAKLWDSSGRMWGIIHQMS